MSDPPPTVRPRALSAAIGGCWGTAAGGLIAGNLRAEAWPLLVAGAFAGAALGAWRAHAPSLDHPRLAVLAAAAGALMMVAPEPAFFLLVPLVVASVAWPLAPADAPAPLKRALPPWTLPAVFAVGAAVMFVQSANRYWAYGAGSKDLGLFYQTHWLIAHGFPPLNTVMGMHALADHMELLDYVIAPLLRVHDGATTLLLAQALAVASAVFPLGWMGARVLESSRAGLALAAAWLLAPDVHAGVMFDYNPMLLGSAALLWTAWALLCRGTAASVAAAVIACLAREDLCLYVAVLAAVLAVRGAPWRRGAAIAALALAVFAVEVIVLFPRFRPSGFRHWEQFEEAGEATASSGVAAPSLGLATAMVDHPQKRRSMLQPLTATGFIGLADPLSIVLQVPNWGERFFSSYGTRWWGYHYGVPAAATALVGAILGWRRLRRAGREGRRMGAYLTGCALVTGLLPPYSTPSLREHRVRRSEMYLARPPYAMASEDVRTADAAVRFIGRNPYVAVAAQDRLLPHLAGRRTILMLDRALEAEFIVLQLNGATWPDGRPSWRRRVAAIAATGAYGVAFCEGQTIVLRREAPSLPCPSWEAFLSAKDYGAGSGLRRMDTSQDADAATVNTAPATQTEPAPSIAPDGVNTPGARNR